ncbi:MAG: 4Fe-4S dicluster domain-containing protein [Geobacteraceae bacterium]|nr:4Fe-4S dicluster domain-containing protein [Geobacteraceae bacterium]
MLLRSLKPLRVAIAACFFISTSFLFLDFREIGAHIIAEKVLFLQFVPSILNFLHHAVLGSAGFIVVLGMTLLFGRVYCSTICPLGTAQDIIARLSRKRRFNCEKKPKGAGHRFSMPHTRLRYTILSLTALLLLGGNGLLLNLFDPFSSFGRIVSNLVRPLVLSINNLGAVLAEYVGSHALYRVQWPAIAPLSVGVSLTVLIVVGWLNARHGRLYCNTLCPVGTLLGLLSKCSLFRIRFTLDTCIGCGLCESVCKAACIDINKQEIDVTRCVGCINCLNVCPVNALRIGRAPQRQASLTRQKPGRRTFIVSLVAAGMSMLTSRTEAEPQKVDTLQSRPTTIPEKKTGPVAPPGSASIAHFTSLCTACHLCVSACPSRVLVPSFLAYGLSGIMQPQLDFQASHCNFDCTICGQVCPSGAILPLVKESKKRTQVGVAKFIKENCVVYTANTNCGACSEHCPTKAVHMVPYVNGAGKKLVIPEVNGAVCVGCGGCEHACPTRPYKAIYVDGNPVHKLAQKPVETPLNQQPETSEDFPF